MKSIKKRFAKARIISKMVHFEGNKSSSEADEDLGETTTLTTECTVAEKGSRIEIEYEESAITGLEGSKTKVFFDKSTPTLVSILREGAVSTALVFEEGRRHLCVYETPYFPIELCVNTISLENSLDFNGGTIKADYTVEMNGVLAEKTTITITLM